MSSCRNRVLFTRIAKTQNSFKRFLTNDIVWVLLLFSKKNLENRIKEYVLALEQSKELLFNKASKQKQSKASYNPI